MCPDLTDPANGMVVMAGSSVGDTATYSCNSGFELVGIQTVTCQADGMWSDPPPTCEPIGMKSPPYCRVIIMAFTYSKPPQNTYYTVVCKCTIMCLSCFSYIVPYFQR